MVVACIIGHPRHDRFRSCSNELLGSDWFFIFNTLLGRLLTALTSNLIDCIIMGLSRTLSLALLNPVISISLCYISQYCGCWWPGEARSQGISSHGIDLVLLGYSSLSNRKVNPWCIVFAFYIIIYHLFSAYGWNLSWEKYLLLQTLYLPCAWCRPGNARRLGLTHWGQDKMDASFQSTLPNAFSWMKMYKFHLRFHWSLFPRIQWTIFHHWFR